MYADGMLSSEEYLEHHGIKGQKWGVRRFQNPDGSLTEAGKKRYRTNGDTVFTKGTEFYRVSTSKEDSEKNDYKYVSYLQRDRAHYKGGYAQDIMFDPEKYTVEQYQNTKLKDIVADYKASGHEIYEITYKATRDLLSPSKKKRVECLKDMIEKDPSVVDRTRKFLEQDAYFGNNESIQKDVAEVFDKCKHKKLSEIADDDKGLRLFSAALNNEATIRKQYFSILKSAGYDIIIDDHDKVSGLTIKPLIVINPADAVQQVAAKELFAKDIGEAWNQWAKASRRSGYTENEIPYLDKSEWE